jgi:two-component system NarL family sensor kinase
VERTLSMQSRFFIKPLQLGMILFAIISLLVVATFALGVANEYSLTLLSLGISQPLAALIGGLIIARQPRNLVGWCIAAHSFFFTFPEFARQYVLYAVITNPGSLPFGQELAWFAYWMWGPGILFGFILLPLYFPNGQLVSPRWRYVLWYAVITSIVVTVGMALSPGDYETPGIPNPLGMLPVSYVETWFGESAQVTWLAGMVLAVISLLVRFRRANVQEKQQIKWIFYAMLLLLIFLFMPVSGVFAEITGAIAIGMLWVAIGIAVLRYGLYNIDIIISRTLVYGALTAVIVAAYLLTAGVLGALIPSGSNLFNTLIAAGLVALIFQPLRERLQRSVNRLLYGERDEPYALLTRLGRRLEETLAPDQTLPTIVETVAVALKLPYVAIALQEGEKLALAAEYVRPPRPEAAQDAGKPETNNNVVTIPLTHQRQQLGELRLGLRPGEQSFSAADWRLLNALARQISTSVSSVQLSHALQLAREQLVVAREEERRRLRRDLHDGLGPVLAAQRLKLGSARYFLHQDPTVADRLLAEQEQDLDAALQEVRRLIDNLRPPALDDLGLAVAIQRVAEQYGTTGDGSSSQRKETGLQIEVDVPATLPPLPAAVEVACYRIVQEALTNVVRHAQARHCWLTLKVGKRSGGAPGDRALFLTIADDGVGIGTPSGSGLGLHSMRARAEELGGTMSIAPNRPKGTLLRVQLPLASGFDASAGGQETPKVGVPLEK